MVEVENKTQRYKKYKESGVEWLEEVPEHWEVGRLGSILNPVSSKNHPNEILLSITREKGVIVRDMENLDDNHNYIPDDLTGYKLLKEGQFGMNKMKAWQGSYGVSSYTGIVSPAYYTFEFTKNIDPRFFHIAIRSKLYVSFFGKASDGVRIGQWDLSKDRMKRIPLAIPPLTEQTKIAQFLDDKTTKIDEAIAIKEQQINLLKERKQILIHKAVTRGLDDSVPLKDSGVEWIGEIPEHWEVKKLTYLTKFITCGLASTPTYVNEEIGKPFLSAQNVRPFKMNYKKFNFIPIRLHKQLTAIRKIEKGDLLLTRVGAGIGDVAIFNEDLDCAVYVSLTHIRVLKSVFNKFIMYFLGSYAAKLMHEEGTVLAGGQGNLNVNNLRKYRFSVPPLSEQKEISAYIETASQKIETAIGLKQQEIEKLKEYKRSLINGVVTGKVKVC
ncbi:restriction endonuclease subunit S [Croceibacter atlanticus]|uniref:restriction endonuclease subunit S n=1 Tax=Croceibacter atlanticus TaxID=313588 RepID=UPI001C5F7E2E|nr:restriction endonuclease subunit S [Croceibacter atlanticus]MBW4968851.1 restriction endonuclease subunit S [Croceibacter atlanticus]